MSEMLCLKSRNRAPTARYIKARGKCEAKRSASPLDNRIKCPVALKGRNTRDISAFQALYPRAYCNQGRRAPLRFALAPGFHIPRLWRSVSTFEAKPGQKEHANSRSDHGSIRAAGEPGNTCHRALNQNVCCRGVFGRCGRRRPSLNPFLRRQAW